MCKTSSESAEEPVIECPASEMHATLFHLVTGQSARIIRIRDTGVRGIRQRLLDMGVTRGTTLRVVRHAPLGDPVEVVVKGYHLALRMHEAAQIEVEVL